MCLSGDHTIVAQVVILTFLRARGDFDAAIRLRESTAFVECAVRSTSRRLMFERCHRMAL